MRCRGIIFSGIMGALLASFSAQAATTTEIASKQYVDKKEAAILENVSNTYETKENVTNLTEQVTNLGDTINNPETGLAGKVEDAVKDAAEAKAGLELKEDKKNKVTNAEFDTVAATPEADTKYPTVKAVDEKLKTKANVSDVYTKAETYDQATIDEKIAEISSGGEVDLSGYQRTDKRVDTVRDSATATIENYPSEKAVADALAGKADSSALADLATKEELEGVKTSAETAQSTAETAQSTAGEAKTTADSAKTAADDAKRIAEAAQAGVDSKVDKAQGAEKANKVLITDESGNVITGTVSSDMITDGAISNADIADNAEIAQSKISGLTDALAGKANTGDLANLATKDEVNLKADKTELDAYAKTESLKPVAFSGSYNDLENKPVIPEGVVVDETLTPEGTNAVQGKAIYEALQGKQEKGDYATKTELDAYAKTEDLATVAKTGSYNDLADKPTIPEGVVVDTELTPEGTNAVQGKAIYEALQGKQEKGDYATKTELAGKANVSDSLSGYGITDAYTKTETDTKLLGKADKAALDEKENKSNKVIAISEGNQSSVTEYPSVAAIVQWTDKKLSDLSTEGIPVNPGNIPSGAITEDKLDSGLIAKIDGKEDKTNKVSVIDDSNKTDATKYASVKAVADYVIPKPGENCTAESGLCVLSATSDGSIAWVNVTAPAN